MPKFIILHGALSGELIAVNPNYIVSVRMHDAEKITSIQLLNSQKLNVRETLDELFEDITQLDITTDEEDDDDWTER